MTRPRRLCMVVHGPYPVGEPRVAREARAAVDAGFHVTVVAMRGEGEPPHEWVDAVEVHRLANLRSARTRPLELVREYAGFAALAAARVGRLHLSRRFGIVQIHNPPDFLMAAAVLPRLAGARVVFDIHDLAPELFAARLGGSDRTRAAERLLRRVESAAVRLSDSVVTVHEPYRSELRLRGIPDEKIVVVLNALDERLLPAQRPVQDDGFRIVYHGTVTRFYGVELVVDAFARLAAELRSSRLEIYGAGDAIPDVQARVESHGLSDRVTVSGRMVPHEQVLMNVNGASVGVVAQLPIERNLQALPTKLMEYVALGVPVVAPDIPAIQGAFGNDELVFFSAGDASSLAEAIRTVASSPRLRGNARKPPSGATGRSSAGRSTLDATSSCSNVCSRSHADGAVQALHGRAGGARRRAGCGAARSGPAHPRGPARVSRRWRRIPRASRAPPDPCERGREPAPRDTRACSPCSGRHGPAGARATSGCRLVHPGAGDGRSEDRPERRCATPRDSP